MNKGYTDFNATQVNNYLIVDAIDRLYAAQAMKTALGWSKMFEERALQDPIGAHRLFKRLGERWWSEFTFNPREPNGGSWTLSDEAVIDQQQLPDISIERHDCFRAAIRPLILDLQSGRTQCDSIENSANWKKTKITRTKPEWFCQVVWTVIRDKNIILLNLRRKTWTFINVRLSREPDPEQENLKVIEVDSTTSPSEEDISVSEQEGISDITPPQLSEPKGRAHKDKAFLKTMLKKWLKAHFPKPETANWTKEQFRTEAGEIFKPLTGKLFNDAWKGEAPPDRKHPGRPRKQSSENTNP